MTDGYYEWLDDMDDRREDDMAAAHDAGECEPDLCAACIDADRIDAEAKA